MKACVCTRVCAHMHGEEAIESTARRPSKEQGESSGETTPRKQLDLGILASRILRIKFLLCRPPRQWYFVRQAWVSNMSLLLNIFL